MKNFYWLKRSWVYEAKPTELYKPKVKRSVFIATETLELTPDELDTLTLEGDDYDELFYKSAPDWLQKLYDDCPHMCVEFQGLEAVPLTEREIMFMQGQPMLFN